MNFPKSFITVNPFSKYLAMALFVLLPFVGFSLGMKLQSNSTAPQTPVVESNNSTNIKVNKELQQNKKIITRIEDVTAYNKSYSSANYKCYQKDSFPQNKRVSKLNEDSIKNNRTLYEVCINSGNNKILTVSFDTLERDKPYYTNLNIDLDTFEDDNFYTSDFIVHEGANGIPQILDWLTNNDIIYALVSEGGRPHKIDVFVYNSSALRDSTPQSKLIEICQVGIAGGTSERFINWCKTFNEQKTSRYLKKEDLP